MMSRNRRLHPREVFSVLEENPPAWEGLNPETKVGHVHLHVADLATTDQFYAGTLGMERPFVMDTAIFYAAGGYHHHIGTNVWQGVGAPPPPAEATGLRYFTIVFPDTTVLNQIVAQLEKAGIAATQTDDGLLIRDPAQNGLVLTVA
jgi:catechol 2,3-dioxygenase